ncbi:MAG: hypothetical protein NC453_25565 [Muribaculum sp.]|nr:hypothetical protein [Muribaculum sp.]
MKNQYEKYIKWWLAEYGAESEYDRFVSLFPEFYSRLAKFAPGVFQWTMMGEFRLDNPEEVVVIRELLHLIESSGNFDKIDATFLIEDESNQEDPSYEGTIEDIRHLISLESK